MYNKGREMDRRRNQRRRSMEARAEALDYFEGPAYRVRWEGLSPAARRWALRMLRRRHEQQAG